MASISISSQLQAIKTSLNISTDPEPGRRKPLTRPSVLFDGKSAADIDVDTILSIAISGLEVLIKMDERFRNYSEGLFSHKSKELDRELVGVEENQRIDASIASYLRLLSGYLESHSALKTLEYLIRRYRVHVYNAEELILCALPYHDTHVFVQIVQLLNTGNSKWKFLDGVKASGARLPRDVIVQQCIRDMGVLEAMCNYAMPSKKSQPSEHVTGFCTAVIFEVLGLVTVDSDTVKRIFPYVTYGLQPDSRSYQKAGAIMIVCILSQKASLAPSVVKSLMHLVADIARVEAKQTPDIQCLRMSFMTLINIVQLQSLEFIPKKTLDILNEIRDVAGVLSGLNKEFNIDKFFAVFLDSLLQYSASDELCNITLLSLVETFPMKGYVNQIVSKFLIMRMKISKGKIDLVSSESGSKGKQVLVSICEKYPSEARQAFYSFLKEAKMHSKKVNSSYEVLCKILDENLESSHEKIDPKTFLALEHSEPDIRRSAISGLDVANVLGEKAAGSKNFLVLQDALLHRLYDDDLKVVLAILKLENVAEILNSLLLVEALKHVLQRCIVILLSGSPKNTSQHDTALLCLQQVVTNFKDQQQCSMTLATSFFPLILIRPKTQRLNLKALELAKDLSWPFYANLISHPVSDKKLESGEVSSLNMDNINRLADAFSSSPEENLHWLVKCCESEELSKTLFFLVLLQSLRILRKDVGGLSAFVELLSPFLTKEWEKLELIGISPEQSKKRNLDSDCARILEDLSDTDTHNLNSEILACLLLRLLEAFVATEPENESLDMKRWTSALQDLFLFFTSHSKDVFKKHLEYLFSKSKSSVIRIILKLLTEDGISSSTQVEILHSLSSLCSQLDKELALELLEEFPLLLIPLLSDSKDVRMAAMSCLERLAAIWACVGNKGARLYFIEELLQQKTILSDKNVLHSFFTSRLSSSTHSLLVQQQPIEKRFDESSRNEIVVSIVVHALRLPAQAKLKVLSLLKGLESKLISVSGVMSLLKDLLERHQQYLVNGKLSQRLSQSEVDILCLLLECICSPTSSREVQDFGDLIVKALLVNNAEDSAALEPCLTILRNLSSSVYGDMKSEIQVLIFQNLLILFRSTNGDVQNAARGTLLRINLNCSIIERVVDSILDQKACSAGSVREKKMKLDKQCSGTTKNMDSSFIGAFLDVLMMKKNIENRSSLVSPLFKLLNLSFMDEDWVLEAFDQDTAHVASSTSPRSISDNLAHMQHTLLLTLESISSSAKDHVHDFDLQLLLNCARSSNNAITRNHVFSLITTLAKIIPDKVLDNILDILTVIGESTITQWDTYSKRIFEGLISTIVPYWLSKSGNADDLIQIFVNILPQVAEHRRLSVIEHISRTLGEAESLGSLIFLLFRSLISRKSLFTAFAKEHSLDHMTLIINKQWEYEFGVQLCEHYSCKIWLHSLVLALTKIGSSEFTGESFMEMLIAMQFISDALQDPEISYKLNSGEDVDHIQDMAGNLLEQVIIHLELLDLKKKHVDFPAAVKNEIKEYTHSVLKTITKGLLPSTYFKIIFKLINHADGNVRKKSLGLLSETVKDYGVHAKVEKKGSKLRNSWLHLNENSVKEFQKLCYKILTLLDGPDDVGSTPLKLAAVSSIEVLADRFPSDDRVFSMCLRSVCKRISSENSVLSSHCLRATAALVNALGQRALSELPNVMEPVLKRSRETTSASSKSEDSIFMSVLVILESVVNKLGGFLNPYLSEILGIVVLHPSSFSTSKSNLKSKADVVRKLITDKIPIRLLITPILEMYPNAVKSGESSLVNLFEMIRSLVVSMDRSSVGAYHAKLFDLCLLALDLRRQSPDSIGNIDVVEQNVVNAFVSLTMKLTESMFRPLFVKIIEWSGLNVEDDEKTRSRAISFYSLVNKFAESHRSLFVPYFKHMLDGFVRGLVETESGVTHKKKKAKHGLDSKERDGVSSLEQWHIQALILSALHKCFLYDTGSLKFLDSTNFQVLLKPIVSQLVIEPPTSAKDPEPSVREVDDLLVDCVSQMAVTAGSDLLWKPLNHEVLMQTRSEKVRARILGLRIVKSLLEKLKEEYLQFLPETIPFLAELLEDTELPVKSLAQEILKEMETMSGESLAEYLHVPTTMTLSKSRSSTDSRFIR